MELKEIHKDNRRTINVVSGLLDGEKEFSFIRLNKWKAIGGCIHDEDEYFVVVHGTVQIMIGEQSNVYGPGQGGTFPAGVPHAFIAGPEESIVCEWGITKTAKDTTTYNSEMRKYVNDFNDDRTV